MSVIIPTLNRAKLTLEALGSVEAQSYPNLEVVVVDNGSRPSELKIMQANGVGLLHCGTLGAGAARKFGLENAAGDLVMFLDSDDLLSANAIETLVKVTDSSFDGGYGLIKNENHSPKSIANLEKPSRWPMASNTLLRRSALDAFGEMTEDNFSFPRWVTQALDFGLNLAFADEIVATRRVYGDNVSLQSKSMEFFFQLIRERRSRQA